MSDKMSQSAEDKSAVRRPPTSDGQMVPSKVLGVPTVFVEALDAEGAVVVEKVESEVALLWPFVQKEVVLNKRGKSEENPVQLPKQVGQDILALLLEYCRYHRFPGRSDKERKLFDEKFIRLDTRRLCELTSAADSLDMKPLVDLSSRALARMIEGKTPEEIRETFHLPDDLTEEEKLEPVRNLADDPRIRLLNRLYAKKRKELADKKAELLRRENGHKDPAPASQDTRSVEELLSFIEEERQESTKARAKRKKPKKKREQASEATDSKLPSREAVASSGLGHSDASQGEHSGAAAERPSNRDVGDTEMDDEVEAFERSLNADWEDRRAELILMAGAYPSRPTRVTTLTSLSNFKARPRDAVGRGDVLLEPQTRGSTSPDPSDAQHARSSLEVGESVESGESDTSSREPEGPAAAATKLEAAECNGHCDRESSSSHHHASGADQSEGSSTSDVASELRGALLGEGAGPSQGGNIARGEVEQGSVLDSSLPLIHGNGSASHFETLNGPAKAPGDVEALTALLQEFVDKLGLSKCIDIVTNDGAGRPLDRRSVHLEKRIGEFGLFELTRL